MTLPTIDTATTRSETMYALGAAGLYACWMQVPRIVVDSEGPERPLERVAFLRRHLGRDIDGIKVCDPAEPNEPDDLFVVVWGGRAVDTPADIANQVASGEESVR